MLETMHKDAHSYKFSNLHLGSTEAVNKQKRRNKLGLRPCGLPLRECCGDILMTWRHQNEIVSVFDDFVCYNFWCGTQNTKSWGFHGAFGCFSSCIVSIKYVGEVLHTCSTDATKQEIWLWKSIEDASVYLSFQHIWILYRADNKPNWSFS